MDLAVQGLNMNAYVYKSGGDMAQHRQKHNKKYEGNRAQFRNNYRNN